jgi:hypothetical protein
LPAVLPGIARGLLYGVIIVAVNDYDLGALFFNCLDSHRTCGRGNVDLGSEFVFGGHPGNGASMISFGRANDYRIVKELTFG